MKHSLTLTLILTMFASSAMAETATPPAKESPNMGNMMGGKMYDRMNNHMEYMWEQLDTNNDGAISKEESTAFSNKKFEEKDANKDGKITKEEWESYRADKMKQRQEKMQEIKKKMDEIENKKPASPAEEKKK